VRFSASEVMTRHYTNPIIIITLIVTKQISNMSVLLKRQFTKSVRSYYSTLTTLHCPQSPAKLLCAVQQSIDISRRPGKATSAAVAHGRADGRTDRRTPDRCIDPAAHTTQAVPITTDKQTADLTNLIPQTLMQ